VPGKTKARNYVLAVVGVIGFLVLIVIVAPYGPVIHPAAPPAATSTPAKASERRTPSGVTLQGACAPATERWADGVRRLANERSLPGRISVVLCRDDGSVYVALVNYQHSVLGSRIVKWYPEDGPDALTRAMIEGRK
jgi:hypothetical protein